MLKHLNLLVAVGLFTTAPLAYAQTQMDQQTPEQRTYEGRTDSQIRSWIHEQNKAVTQEERAFIDQHWARSARIFRVRHLADQAHDAAIVTRCDALIARGDHILEEQIRRFREHAPVMTSSPSEIEVTTAPPPPQAETQGAPPAPQDVWQPGVWQWNGARHVWSPGHWTAPPQPGMAWDPARWQNRNGRWAYTEGRWHAGAQPAAPTVYEPPPPTPAQDVVVQTTPPAPIVEVRPAGPANGVWIPGYWHWSGARHVWVAGRWSAPRAGMRWEPDHWEHVGNGYRMVHGRWAK